MEEEEDWASDGEMESMKQHALDIGRARQDDKDSALVQYLQFGVGIYIDVHFFQFR